MRRSCWVVAVLVAWSFEHGADPKYTGGSGSGSGSDSGSGSGSGSSTGVDAATDAPSWPPPSITCPGAMCGYVCCDGTCTNPSTSSCAGRSFRCDGPEDCTGSEVCCNDKMGSYCTTQLCDGNGHFEACHTSADCSTSCNDCSFREDYGQMVCCE